MVWVLGVLASAASASAASGFRYSPFAILHGQGSIFSMRMAHNSSVQ